MDQVDLAPILVRWVHIAAAIVAIGGAVFMRFALLPALREIDSDRERANVADAVRRRWAKLVHACIALLLLTGIGNFVLLAMKANLKPMPYHAMFGVKFLLALAVFFLASALVGKKPGFARIRERPAGPLSAIVVLGFLIALLSGTMNQVRHSPRAQKPAPQSTAPKPP